MLIMEALCGGQLVDMADRPALQRGFTKARQKTPAKIKNVNWSDGGMPGFRQFPAMTFPDQLCCRFRCRHEAWRCVLYPARGFGGYNFRARPKDARPCANV